MSTKILEALGVACELTNTTLSEGALCVIAEELGTYPEPQILAALRQCCKELTSKLTLAEILSRLDDGRPPTEEAWAMMAQSMQNESLTLVWTEEMRLAYGVALGVQDEPIAARMAFKEAYTANVRKARDAHEPVRWSVSLGSDQLGRERAILEGVKAGRLLPAYAHRVLPHPDEPETLRFLEQFFPRLLE